MQSVINRNLLKHAAGTAIFCPKCESLLDWRTTAIVSLGPNSSTVCTKCLDALKARLGDKINNVAIDILDGRDA